VFGGLELLQDEKGKTVFRVGSSPLKDVLDRIEERANYGDTASGRFLSDEFGKEPFGWDLDAVRLLIVSLLRAGRIEATSKGQTLDSVTGIDARETFSNNNLFKQAAFRPKKGVEFEELIKASEAFRDTFGSEVRELNVRAIVEALRREIDRHEDSIAASLGKLVAHGLPGAALLEGAVDQFKAISRGSDEGAIAIFNASHRSIKDAIKRAGEIEQSLSEPRLRDLQRARQTLSSAWPFLRQEANIGDELRAQAAALHDILARETFYRELPALEQHTRAIQAEYDRRYDDAMAARIAAYSTALERLAQEPGWTEIAEHQQHALAAAFKRSTKKDEDRPPIPQLRSERDAAGSRLRDAIAELHRIIDGERVASVSLTSYFAGGIETEEQLDAALDGIREECTRLIGAGKKVILQ
jgi:hypothetical protein